MMERPIPRSSSGPFNSDKTNFGGITERYFENSLSHDLGFVVEGVKLSPY